jgi:hypothetical protein
VDTLPVSRGAGGSRATLGTLPVEIADLARSVRNQPLAERMQAISSRFLGRPYLADPLGEGEGPDSDPLARYDVFDCLTFVEEVLALTLTGEPEHAAAVRLSLRYGDAPPTYAHRRHFMELQWIPGNIQSGWLRDSTADYGPVRHMERDVDAATWAGWSARKRFALQDEDLPTGTMSLDVLSLDDAIAAADAIRPGSLLLTVRVDRPGVPIWTSHVGFILPGATPRVRHATRMGTPSVRDHDLRWYLRHLKDYSRWPAAGVAILEPVESGPRRSLAP